MSAVDRRLLPHTFGPWFARFQELTEVQRLAIPAAMSGRDVLVSSATASGKTEAYAAPAVERALAAGRREGCRVLVVSPTRALANDLRRRLEGPMALVGVDLGRHTGEHKERRGGGLATFTITTLEALDSLLARRPAALEGIVTVVLDEVHVVDGTARGDQLRVLLERLTAVAPGHQRIAASATVDDPAAVGARYLRDPELVVVPGARRILGRFFEGLRLEDMGRHLDELATAGFRKLLVFCQSRNQVELYSSRLPGRTRFEERIFAHHGSLARGQRERTERLFQHAPAAVCFATLTLEMGIDIGTVDYVLLAGAPADVASLLQRIGRGGRRGDTTRAGFAVRGPAERHVVATMARLGKEGHLCAPPYGFRPSVLVQQALVLACARGSLAPAELAACLPAGVREELPADAVPLLFEALEEAELLERSGGRWVPSEGVEARYVRGTLHSNIEDLPGLDVVDRLTGDVIGRILHTDSAQVRLGGGDRAIVAASGRRLLTDRGQEGKRAYFRPAGSPCVSLAQARAVVEGLVGVGFAVRPGTAVQVPTDRGWLLLHGLGTVGSLLLTALLPRARCEGRAYSLFHLVEAGPYGLRLELPLDDLPRPGPGDLELFAAGHLVELAPLVAPGPWDRVLPRELRLGAIRRCTGLDRLAAVLGGLRLVSYEDPVPELEGTFAEL